MQTAMRGGNLVDKYVEGYTYINLRSGWILSNNGMYRLADAANRDEVAHLLGEWAEQHAAMMWVNRTDQPTPARADTPLNTVDLTGELLVLRSSSYRTGSYAVLIVKLDLSPLYEMTESWQTGGYSIAARDFTGKTVIPFATSGGSDMGKTADILRAVCPAANILPGKRMSARESAEAVRAWVETFGK